MGNTDERIEEAVRLLREHMVRNEGDLDVHERALSTLLVGGQAQRAVEELGNVVRARPELLQLHFDLAARLLRASHGPALLASLQAQGDSARQAIHEYCRGLIHQAGSSQEQAESAYRRAVAADGRFAAGHCGLGNALEAQDRLEEALESFRKAIELAPAMAEPHLMLAGGLRKKNLPVEARGHIERFIELAQPYHSPYVHFARQLMLLTAFSEDEP